MALTQDVTMTRATGVFGAYAAAGAQGDTPGGLVVQEIFGVHSHVRSVKTNRFPWIKRIKLR